MSFRSLVQILREQRGEIVARFVALVQRADLAPPGTSRSELADHIPFFLDEIAADLESAASACAHAAAPARRHAGQRWRLGYDIGSLVREYGLVRQCILQVAHEQRAGLTELDFDALARRINACIAEAATTYVAFRDAQLHEKNAHLEFLAEAGELLASSLDYRSTISRLAGLLVPRLADWCAIHLVGEPVEAMPLMHVDPAKIAVLREIYRRYPLGDSEQGFPYVMRTGKPVLVREIEAGLAERVTADPEQLERLRQIGSHSWLIVPLRVQATTFGALTLAYSESPRRYVEQDLLLASDVARRAAGAIDSARLYALSQSERLRVEAATRAKDEFVAMISHELRTPLNAIVGWMHLLRSGALQAAQREHALDVIDRNAQAQSRLVSDLLDVSRVITGQLCIHPQPLQLAQVVERARAALAAAAQAREIRVELLVESEGTLLHGDAERLQQLFANLLSNALKFTPQHGLVQIRLRRAGSDLEVSVEDDGAGIDPSFMPHLFESFRQANSGSARPHGGLGIGLSIARRIVELHGGTLTAHSDGPGRGARFVARLPAGPPVSPPAPAAQVPVLQRTASRADAPSLQGLRALVVDDDPDARELVVCLFEASGMEVRATASASEALGALETFAPDVIVSDIAMPGEDGHWLIRSVRALSEPARRSTPAIALTAYSRSEDRARALVAGFNAHLAKPVEPEILLQAIAELTQQTRG